MSVKGPERYFKTLEEVYNLLQDWFNNLGLDDLKPSNVRTEAPTVATLNKGRFAIVQLSGVPYIYYHTTGGVLYRIAMTAV